MSRSALVVFAKTPRPGASKTRLVPPLSYDDAAALSRCFIADVASTVAAVAALRGATPCIAYDGDAPAMRSVVGEAHRLIPQRGTGFGTRLRNAARDALDLGHQAVCLIGSDSPTLPPRLLEAALDALQRAGDHVVVGPAHDGGYYLIGLKHVHRALFSERIAWSTARVAAQTIEAARDCGIEPVVLDSWYDIDDAASLAMLRRELTHGRVADGLAPATRAYLARIGAGAMVASA